MTLGHRLRHGGVPRGNLCPTWNCHTPRRAWRGDFDDYIGNATRK